VRTGPIEVVVFDEQVLDGRRCTALRLHRDVLLPAILESAAREHAVVAVVPVKALGMGARGRDEVVVPGVADEGGVVGAGIPAPVAAASLDL